MKIVVTGIGIVSGIGLNAEDNLNALKSGRTGIKRSPSYDLMLAEVSLTNEQILKKYGLPHEDYSRTTLLGIIAANEAWGDNKLSENIRTGLISATSVGGLDRMEDYYFKDHAHKASAYYHLMTHDNGRTTERIAGYFGISGYIGTLSTACSSGANAIMHGARLMEANKLDRVLVGGIDPLADFDIKGFRSLNIYDPGICKPFDDSRNGLNLGEGAAFLVLENEHSLSQTGNTPLCFVSGWNNSTDAFHQTASSANGTGATLTMQKALEKANLSPENISYINAHGTGTGNNDLSESIALKNIFGAQIPAFSSTKGFTGHTLAAAGAIEAANCVQAIRSQAFLPNLNFVTPMKETGFIPVTVFKEHVRVDHILSNSFGFGGNCTSLIFSKI